MEAKDDAVVYLADYFHGGRLAWLQKQRGFWLPRYIKPNVKVVGKQAVVQCPKGVVYTVPLKFLKVPVEIGTDSIWLPSVETPAQKRQKLALQKKKQEEDYKRQVEVAYQQAVATAESIEVGEAIASGFNFMPHQEKALKLACSFKDPVLALDMGLGKTLTGFEFSIRTGLPIVLICPNALLENWRSFITDNYDVVVKVITSKEKTRVITCAEQVTLVPFSMVWRSELKNCRDFTLLVDESSLLLNLDSKQSVQTLELISESSRCCLMSGTLFGGKVENLKQLFRVLNYDPSFIDEHYTKQAGGVAYQKLAQLGHHLALFGFICMRASEVGLPNLTFSTRLLPSLNSCKGYVKDAEKTDEKVVNLMTELVKCCTEEKRELLRSLLSDVNEPVVVSYNFNKELDWLRELSEELGLDLYEINGSSRSITSDKEVKWSDKTLIAAQYASASYGFNLQKARLMLMLSPSLSIDKHDQAQRRIRRLGSKSGLRVIGLCHKDSTDEKLFKRLEIGASVTESTLKSC